MRFTRAESPPVHPERRTGGPESKGQSAPRALIATWTSEGPTGHQVDSGPSTPPRRGYAQGERGRRQAWLVVLGAALALSACVKSAPLPPLTGPVDPGPTAPLDLSLPLYPSGQLHPLAADRGKVVMLDVWATWCDPCRDSLPMYSDLLKQYGPKGFVLYAISVDEDPSQIGPFLKSIRVDVPVLLDPGGSTAEKVLRVDRMPTTFLLDRSGVIRRRHEGFSEDFLQRYQNEIEALLNGT